MDTQLMVWLELGAIGILAGTVVKLLRNNNTLKILLAEEKRKRTYPLLTFEVDRSKLKAYLKNESYCYAKDVQIDDMVLTADYGFKKDLNLKFDPIVLLRPGGSTELEYKVFDNGFDVTTQSPDSLVLQFKDSPSFKMHMRYKNLEEEGFESTVAWQENQYVVKDLKPLELAHV